MKILRDPEIKRSFVRFEKIYIIKKKNKKIHLINLLNELLEKKFINQVKAADFAISSTISLYLFPE